MVRSFFLGLANAQPVEPAQVPGLVFCETLGCGPYFQFCGAPRNLGSFAPLVSGARLRLLAPVLRCPL